MRRALVTVVCYTTWICGVGAGRRSVPDATSDARPTHMPLSFTPSAPEEREEWQQLLEQPSPSAIKARKELLARADQLVHDLPDGEKVAEKLSLDVVVVGCGFKVLHFIGVFSILSRLEARGCLTMHRILGASSGAKAPVHLLLAGEALTLDHHLSYGEMSVRRGLSSLRAALRNDRCACVTTDFLLERFERRLPQLDDKAHILIAQHTLFGPRSVCVNTFTDDSIQVVRQRLRELLYATGTLLTRVEGYGLCSDGCLAGSSHRFDDDVRDQLVCDPRKSGLPSSMVFAYSPEEAIHAIECGQDDAIALFRGVGTHSPAGALELIRRVDRGVCVGHGRV